jgi:hypothetical protein
MKPGWRGSQGNDCSNNEDYFTGDFASRFHDLRRNAIQNALHATFGADALRRYRHLADPAARQPAQRGQAAASDGGND